MLIFDRNHASILCMRVHTHHMCTCAVLDSLLDCNEWIGFVLYCTCNNYEGAVLLLSLRVYITVYNVQELEP